ncbi:MAG: DUF6325 family protein [Candidatus Nanopelagicales bacterium]
MTESQDDDMMGPIDYLVVEYPGGAPTGEGLPHLVELVDKGIVRILDAALIHTAGDGSYAVVRPEDLVAGGEERFSFLQEVQSGLLDSSDLDQVAAIMDPDSTSVVLVYENAWAAPLGNSIRRAGGEVIATGRVTMQDIADALDIVGD